MIRFLRENEIEREKWDACISNSRAAHIYGHSWYLDLVAPGWAGLIKGDYEAVMPLPLKKKYGLTYAPQAFLAQQLGVYHNLADDKTLTGDFLKYIPKFIKYLNFNLNFTNTILTSEYNFTKKRNFELDLSPSYSQIQKGYSANARRNIQRAAGVAMVKDSVSIEGLISLQKQNSKMKMTAGHYEWMAHFCNALIGMGAGHIIGVEVKGKLCATAFFVSHGKRIYYFLPVSNEEGRYASAMFLVLDSVIKKKSDSDLTLDFEGSIIPGIARFFESFGAKQQTYYEIKMNRLPFLLKYIKR